MSYTAQNHKTTYPSISTARPEVSVSGKVVLITGGNTGIGKATALSFAAAGAKAVAVLARREAEVKAAAKEISDKYPAVKALPLSADVTDAAAVNKAFASVKESVGPVDVVVHSAGSMGTFGPFATTDIDETWKIFEINIKGTLAVAQALLAHGAASQVLVVLATAGIVMPALPGMGSYLVSKTPLLKLLDYLAAENPTLRAMNVNPGIVRTEGADKIEESGVVFPPEAYNDVSLSADFIVWAASEEAAFLKNRFIAATWDVDELKARKTEIESSQDLTLVLAGFPRAA